MSLKKVSLLAAAAVSLAAFGCSGAPDASSSQGEVRSELQRNTSPDVTVAEKAELVTDQTAFAIDFYKHFAKSQTGNVVVSPHSIASALAMTYAGALGDTQKEMGAALHFGLGPDRVHPAFNWMDLELASRGNGAKAKDGTPQRIAVNNALFGEKTLHFEKPFLDTLALNYGAGMNTVDFKSAPDAARLGINSWVKDKTEGKIENLLKEGAIESSSRLVLVNTVYLSAAWDSKFEKTLTHDNAFTTADGASTSVATMHQTAGYASEISDSETAVELPYESGDLAMLFVMPTSGSIDAYESALTAKTVGDISARLEGGVVQLSLPKFKLAPETVKLSKELEALGMGRAFSGAADFGGITKDEPLQIAEVHHKAFIDLDEDGTEAAAATAVEVKAGSASNPEKLRKVTLDHPFLFLLRDHKTGQILFMGRVANPKG
ncbi:MAG: Serine protease [Myxococcaceae bacterium]|jgi:serpin B|nr:Serine protease [Myxococcaceae bacterium]